MSNKIALITGGSRGLGFALAEHLAKSGWKLVVTARNPTQLQQAKNKLAKWTEVIAVAGDVQDEAHLLELARTLETIGWKLDLVVNNASALGVSPMRPLLEHSIEEMHTVLHTNMIAPISLLQKIKSHFSTHTAVINVSSDAGKEIYERWGVYGGSKAGLDHMTAILGVENPEHRFYAFDPGDMRTDMQQEAFPGEDISNRPLPEEQAVPAMLELVESDLPGGRYTVHSIMAIEHGNHSK